MSDVIAVKSLEWSEFPIPPVGEHLATSVVGLYCIKPVHGGFILTLRDKYPLGTFKAFGAAKDAAKSHYEASILSVIVLVKPLEPTA